MSVLNEKKVFAIQNSFMLAIDFPGKNWIVMMNKMTSEIIRDIFLIICASFQIFFFFIFRQSFFLQKFHRK